MRLNSAPRPAARTHEGAPAVPPANAEAELRRAVLSCLLWEDQFYESGQAIADRIENLAASVPIQVLADLAIEARSQHNLRHVPLLLVNALVARGRGTALVGTTIERVIQRADEMAELLAIYWRQGKRPLAKQLQKGLAAAFRKFDAYALGKYNRDAAIKLRDVLFLVHPKPTNPEQQAIWDLLAKGELQSPDTWEVALSGGADKRETFERLIREKKLGYLALLRNLRNMAQAGCDPALVRDAIVARRGAERVLPFRYVAAARAAPQFEPAIDEALTEAVANSTFFYGVTVILVDVSGSMDYRLSAKSDLTRLDAAATLASVVNGNLRVFSFSERVVEVAPRRGMAGVDAVIQSQPRSGTYLGAAVNHINNTVAYDRIIVITDEQSHDSVGAPLPGAKGYMINVASYQNGVGYGPWTRIDGFSESVLRFIGEHERQGT